MGEIHVGTRELKNRLSEYLRRVKAGETIMVTERGKIIGQIVRLKPSLYGPRDYGAMHLAVVLIWQESTGSPVTLATVDRELWLAGEKEQLTVWPGQR